MYTPLVLTGLVSAICQTVLAATADEWRSRSIYQVLTDRFARSDHSTTATCKTADRVYCGGDWNGITEHLDYIQGMGFDAIWISPITAQIPTTTPYGDAYHGYWQTNIFNVNDHFGNVVDLQYLANTLHSRGMFLMVDIVTNHFGWDGGPDTIDYTQLTPFASQDHFHTYCPVNYTKIQDLNQLQTCWEGDKIVALPDLRTESPDVVNTWSYWIQGTVSQYKIDGLRLDSAMEVDPSFWSTFVAAAGVFAIGEVFSYVTDFVCSYQKSIPGVLNYPVYNPLVNAFWNTTGNMSALANVINVAKSSCQDTSLLGSFSENHDVPRFASLTGDMSLAQNLLTYTILADGIPIVYQGQEQHYNALGGSTDPYNREALWFSNYNTDAPLYQLIAKLNQARHNAIYQESAYLAYKNWPIHIDGNTLAMRKGDMVTVLTNSGVDATWYTLNLASGYSAGTQLTEVLTCTSATVDSNGNLAVPMAGGLPRVYYPTAKTGYQCSGSNKKQRDARAAIPFQA